MASQSTCPSASPGLRKRRCLRLEYLERRTVLSSVALTTEHLLSIDSERVSQLHVADMDGDGDMDLLTALRADGITRVAWFGQEDDAFGPPQQYGRDVYPVSVVDVDGDGDMDVVSSTGDSWLKSYGWMENLDGRGTLAEHQTILTEARGVLPVDIDGDGDLDMLSTSPDESVAAFSLHSFSKVSLHENLDGRTFRYAGILAGAIESNFLSVDAVDMDGDGDLDVTLNLYSPHTSERLTWVENTRFGDEHWILNSFYWIDASLFDLDGDGDLDVIGNDERYLITLYENTDGEYSLLPYHEIDAESLLALVDLDNDGDIDLLTRSDNGIVWRDIAGKSLIDRQTFQVTGVAEIVDFDGDGRVDLISTDGSEVLLHKNRLPGDSNGDGVFNLADIILAWEKGHYEDDLQGNSSWEDGDWNGDGEFDSSDLVFAFQQSRFDAITLPEPSALVQDSVPVTVSTDSERGSSVPLDFVSKVPLPFSEGLGKGPNLSLAGSGASRLNLAFASHTVKELKASDTCLSRGMRVGDIDGDGDNDLLWYDDSSLNWYQNVDGVFGDPMVIHEQSVNDVVVGNLDRDSRLDIVASSDRGLVWYELQPGKEAFASSMMADGDNYLDLALADLDGDGDTDLLSRTDDQSVWFENEGALLPPVQISDSVWGQFVDLDDDGDADVLDGLRWRENLDGRGTSSAARIIGRDGAFHPVTHPADIDGDGDLDVVAATYYGELSWYENAAFGMQHVIELKYENYSALYTADLDGDGDIDLLTQQYEDGHPASIGWYENVDGRGTFVDRRELLTGDSLQWVSINDMDSDGRLDLIVAGCRRLSWHEQRLPGDANDDGVFDSTDLIKVFAAGKYEDDIADNASFDEGDWDGDGDFTRSDIVFAFDAQATRLCVRTDTCRKTTW